MRCTICGRESDDEICEKCIELSKKKDVHPIVCYNCHKVCALITLLPFPDDVPKEIKPRQFLFTMECKNCNSEIEKYDFLFNSEEAIKEYLKDKFGELQWILL